MNAYYTRLACERIERKYDRKIEDIEDKDEVSEMLAKKREKKKYEKEWFAVSEKIKAATSPSEIKEIEEHWERIRKWLKQNASVSRYFAYKRLKKRVEKLENACDNAQARLWGRCERQKQLKAAS